MGRKQVLVQLNDDLLDRLDKLAGLLKRSRSSLVRDAIERFVRDESNAEKDRRTIEGYTRIPDDDPVLDAWAEQGARQMVEEEPW